MELSGGKTWRWHLQFCETGIPIFFQTKLENEQLFVELLNKGMINEAGRSH